LAVALEMDDAPAGELLVAAVLGRCEAGLMDDGGEFIAEAGVESAPDRADLRRGKLRERLRLRGGDRLVEPGLQHFDQPAMPSERRLVRSSAEQPHAPRRLGDAIEREESRERVARRARRAAERTRVGIRLAPRE